MHVQLHLAGCDCCRWMKSVQSVAIGAWSFTPCSSVLLMRGKPCFMNAQNAGKFDKFLRNKYGQLTTDHCYFLHVAVASDVM